MEKELGEKSKALTKYIGLTTLTKEDATKIINTLWPKAEDASPEEVFKAIAICVQYGLNPLMRHLFLIPYWNNEKKRYDYSCILGITSNRLIASRKHHWSFLDDTPRVSTEEEEIKHYRKVDQEKIRAIAKIKDLDTGAEVTAWGEWPIWKLDKDGNKVRNEPKGVDKGNSMENMACIHAERKGLDMLYPADMPSKDIPVLDESYEADYEEITEAEPQPEPIDEVPRQAPTTEELKQVRDKVDEVISRREAKDTPPSQSVALETKPEKPSALDESPVTKEEIDRLEKLMAKGFISGTQLGHYMNKDKGWNITNLSQLKKWQFDQLIAAFEKGKE